MSSRIFLKSQALKEAPTEYGYQQTVLDADRLRAHAPDFVYVHTGTRNLVARLVALASEDDFEAAVAQQMDHLRAVWAGAWAAAPNSQVIQATFESPHIQLLGHLDSSSFGGASHFITRLNLELAKEARRNPRLLLHDVSVLGARRGLRQWAPADRWYAYKLSTSTEGSVELAYSLAALIGAARGRSKKLLVLDLDNTLWGGVIGDDGRDGIVLGRETARAEAYTAFQEYCLALKHRGVILAVCSKNDEAMARDAFNHPDAALRVEDFAAFQANWSPKSDNIRAIAESLNLGLDSVVFVDDNPAERQIVADELPMVAVPNVGNDVAQYPSILDEARYFETVALSGDDLARSEQWRCGNAVRSQAVASFTDYDAYLESLDMVGEIGAFSPAYLDRITQLTNKTNQFNLTTRRYTRAEIESIAANPSYITLYGRLQDRFGDNGLISVVIARVSGHTAEIDLWLMSCRVLKRGMEDAMFDALASAAAAKGVTELSGRYLPTAKNSMVKDHYRGLSFDLVDTSDGGASSWRIDISRLAGPRNRHIKAAPHAR